jgi:hypothetical protein
MLNPLSHEKYTIKKEFPNFNPEPLSYKNLRNIFFNITKRSFGQKDFSIADEYLLNVRMVWRVIHY